VPTLLELDFKGTPPATGGPPQMSDRVDPGRYRLRVEKADRADSKTGKVGVSAMFRIDSGPFAHKKLVERFYFPRPGTDDSNFGLARFHQLLIALGGKEQTGKVKINLDGLAGKTCLADVDDETVAATDQYPERTVSRPLSFYPNGAFEATAAPAEDSQPALPEEEMPQPKAPAPVEAEEPAPSADADEVAVNIDDLFD